MEEGGRDEMDSLFEGMVLFNPNSSYVEEEINDDPVPESKVDDAPSPATTTGSLHLHPASSQPLDESLFSDLTLISPLPTPTTTSTDLDTTTSVPSVSRQVSKKKKRVGLRIGYARDADEVQPQQTLPDGNASLPSTTATTLPPPQSHVSNLHSHANGNDNRNEKENYSNSNYNSSGDGHSEDDSDKADATLELRSLQIKTLISEKLSHAHQLASSVSAARKDSIAKKRKFADSLHKASNACANLERQLNDACESEDFETAEKLSDDLAAANKEKNSLLATLRDAEAQCDAIDSRMEEVLASQITAEEECASLLDDFAKDASNKADLVIKAAHEQSSRQMDRWFSSTETLEVKKMELEIESHIVNEARTELNTSIECSVEDDKKERESLCKKKDVLVDELEELLALVKLKEQQIAENDCKIKAVDKRIANVVSGFEEMQSNIDSKFGNLQSTLSNIELETKTLSTQREDIDEFLSKEEEREAKLRELAKASAEEAKTYQEVVGLRKNLMTSVLKSREDKVRLANTEKSLSDDVKMLQQVVSTSRVSLQELSTTKSSIQQHIATSKQNILFINKRVPELEAEKKVAAAARNFKEAARIAAEAKSLAVQKDDIQINIEKTVKELEKVDIEITDTVKKLQETEVLISSKEKEVAMARFERLLLTAGSASAERAAALEFGDVEEANLLLAEAEAAESEAKELQSKYEFKVEEFANIPKHFISMELVANLGKTQLSELAASVD